MLGIIEVKVKVNVEKAPEPEELLDALEKAFKSVEQAYPGVVEFSQMRLLNVQTGLAVTRRKEPG